MQVHDAQTPLLLAISEIGGTARRHPLGPPVGLQGEFADDARSSHAFTSLRMAVRPCGNFGSARFGAGLDAGVVPERHRIFAPGRQCHFNRTRLRHAEWRWFSR